MDIGHRNICPHFTGGRASNRRPELGVFVRWEQRPGSYLGVGRDTSPTPTPGIHPNSL